MSLVEIEPTVPYSEQAKTVHALDRSAFFYLPANYFNVHSTEIS
jgi:hypothetical protein